MPRHSLRHSSPERHGLRAAALLALLDELDRARLDPHGLAIARHGEVLFEHTWAPWNPGTPSLVYSVSKTFTALAIGLLASDGRLDITAPVDRYLDLPNPSGLTIRHLLTMNTGHSREQALTMPFSVAEILSTPPLHRPGTHFAYNSPATYVLSALATQVGGAPLSEIVQRRVLTPLGIGKRHWTKTGGLDQGFSGLHLTLDDMLRVGIMLADGGRAGGSTVVPAGFLAEATTAWSDTRSDDDTGWSEWSRGYGYQLWRNRRGFRLDGAYGQFVIVVPETGIVVAYQGATSHPDRTLDALWRLIGAFADTPLPPDGHSAARLSERARDLDSWTAHSALSADPASPMGASEWRIDDAGAGRWNLVTPLGTLTVRADIWTPTSLDSPEGTLAVAVRGAADGTDVLVHLVVTTSPHRVIIRRTGNRTRVGWHTTPLWRPTLSALAIPRHRMEPK